MKKRKKTTKTNRTASAPAFPRDARPRANAYAAAIANLFAAVGNNRAETAALAAMICRVAARKGAFLA